MSDTSELLEQTEAAETKVDEPQQHEPTPAEPAAPVELPPPVESAAPVEASPSPEPAPESAPESAAEPAPVRTQPAEIQPAAASRAVTPIVDYRRTAEVAPRPKRRSRPLRRLRRALREYSIRRSSGAKNRMPLRSRWRKARLRRMRAQRRAATQAALLGQDPDDITIDEPNVVGYAAAVLLLAAIVVVALVVLL